MSEEADPDVLKKVIAALENPKYKWRTIGGIAKETRLTADAVVNVLTSAAETIVRSSVPSKDGDALFTTRARFRQSASVAERLRGAFTNRLN
jgi:hypothetical protein